MDALFHPTHHPDSAGQLSLYACSTCTRRKVKCDKSTPSCSACRKSRNECCYDNAPSSKKRRRPPSEYHARQLLGGQDSLQPPEPPKTASEEFFGKLKTDSRSGKTRLIYSNIWMSLGDDLHPSSDEEEDEKISETNRTTMPVSLSASLAPQPTPIDLQSLQKHAGKLWFFYVQNVDPICKLFHVPSASKVIERATSNPSSITRVEECLLFAVFHIAVQSITEEECLECFGRAKNLLHKGCHDATRLALAKCALLKTTKFDVLQAYVLLLLSLRDTCDATTFWIETGIAVRIAQRMGLHRNAANAAHDPFEVQMRRRVWWQVMILDKVAAQLAGTGMAPAEVAWDTHVPLNIDDVDIWPRMQDSPVERKGATDMFFFMGRMEIGRTLMVRSPVETWGPKRKSWEWLKSAIDDLEERLETKYIRYCDCSVPYHMLAITMARGTLKYCRLRILILQAQGEGSKADFSPTHFSPALRRELVELATRVVDQYIACHTNSVLQRYSWHLDSSLQWDPLIWVLHELCHDEPQLDVSAAWHRVDRMFACNPIIMAQKRILDVAVGRLVLKAWSSTLSRSSNGLVIQEPPYIAPLQEAFSRRKAAREAPANTISADAAAVHDPMVEDELAGEAADWGIDWAFWDQYLHTKDSGF